MLDDPAPAFNLIGKTHTVGLVRDQMHPTVGLGRGLPGFANDFPAHRDCPYFNAGAFWTETSFLGSLSAGALGAIRTGRRYIHFNDQDALNLWLIQEGGSAELPSRFNRLELDRTYEKSDWLRRNSGHPEASETRQRCISSVPRSHGFLGTHTWTPSSSTARTSVQSSGYCGDWAA